MSAGKVNAREQAERDLQEALGALQRLRMAVGDVLARLDVVISKQGPQR